MATKLLFLDCEMGGIDLDKSLLQIALMPRDHTAEDRLALNFCCKLKPNDGCYKVEAEALSVNKINLIEHDNVALKYDHAAKNLYDWLKDVSIGGTEKLTPVGWNMAGDLRFIWEYLLKRGTWEQFVSYRLLDLSSVARFLVLTGKLPATVTSFESCYEELISDSYIQTHSAVNDVEDMIKVYKELIKL